MGDWGLGPPPTPHPPIPNPQSPIPKLSSYRNNINSNFIIFFIFLLKNEK